jgi:hypothetical protein
VKYNRDKAEPDLALPDKAKEGAQEKKYAHTDEKCAVGGECV